MEDVVAGAAAFAKAVFDAVVAPLDETATLADADDFAFDPAADADRAAEEDGFFAADVAEDFAFDPALPDFSPIVPDTVFAAAVVDCRAFAAAANRAAAATLLPSWSTCKRFCCSAVYLMHCYSTKINRHRV